MKVTVYGRRYSEEPKHYSWDADKKFPYFEKVDEQVFEIEAESLRDGERWLIENHPDLYMGGNVVCENGDFACLAVPCEEYGKGNYETVARRVACVKALRVA